uniref:Uncharacterized protein n=1 Tax=Arundo donax TaxID=35708 RepID=A0A0A9DF57_ARUDO
MPCHIDITIETIAPNASCLSLTQAIN